MLIKKQYADKVVRDALIADFVGTQGMFLVEDNSRGKLHWLVFDSEPYSDPDVEFKRLPVGKLTPAKVNAYIDTNVIDLASAKTVLKQLAQMVLLLAKKQGIA